MRELMGVILALVLSGLGAFMGPELYAKWEAWVYVSEMKTQLINARSGMVQRFAQQPAGTRYGSAAFTAGNLITWKIFPDKVGASGSLINPVGGAYVVTGANSQFYIDGDGATQDQCISLVSGFSSGTGISGIAVAGTMAGLGSASVNSLSSGAVTVTTATTACASASNAVRFVMP